MIIDNFDIFVIQLLIMGYKNTVEYTKCSLNLFFFQQSFWSFNHSLGAGAKVFVMCIQKATVLFIFS